MALGGRQWPKKLTAVEGSEKSSFVRIQNIENWRKTWQKATGSLSEKLTRGIFYAFVPKYAKGLRMSATQSSCVVAVQSGRSQ